MPRNMSFALTTEQIKNRTKTVTRRKGWWLSKQGRRIIKPGDILNACVKCMGLKPGEGIERLCQIRVVSVRRESLVKMKQRRDYGREEARREGFPDMTGREFVSMFCRHMGGDASQVVTRIEFEYIDDNACRDATSGDISRNDNQRKERPMTTMTEAIIRQPNGKFAQFSESTSDFTERINMTADEAIALCGETMDEKAAIREVEKAIRCHSQQWNEVISLVAGTYGEDTAEERISQLSK